MNKIVTTILVSSLALGGFTAANADDDRYERGEHYERGHSYEHDSGHHGKFCDKHGMKGQRLEYMIKQLGLSNDQADKVRNIRDAYMPDKKELRNKMRETRKQLREVMHADAIDQDQVETLAKAMGDLKTQKILLRAKMRNEIHQVLTSEQREKMKAMKKEHRGEKYRHGDDD